MATATNDAAGKAVAVRVTAWSASANDSAVRAALTGIFSSWAVVVVSGIVVCLVCASPNLASLIPREIARIYRRGPTDPAVLKSNRSGSCTFHAPRGVRMPTARGCLTRTRLTWHIHQTCGYGPSKTLIKRTSGAQRKLLLPLLSLLVRCAPTPIERSRRPRCWISTRRPSKSPGTPRELRRRSFGPTPRYWQTSLTTRHRLFLPRKPSSTRWVRFICAAMCCGGSAGVEDAKRHMDGSFFIIERR